MVSFEVEPSFNFSIYFGGVGDGLVVEWDVFHHDIFFVSKFADEGGEGEFGEEVFVVGDGLIDPSRHTILGLTNILYNYQ